MSSSNMGNKGKRTIEIPFCMIVGLVFLSVSLIYSCGKKRVVEDPGYTIARYLGGEGKGRALKSTFCYEVNGKHYFLHPGPANDEFVLGEKFVVAYSQGKPENAEILFCKPVLLQSERTGKVVTKSLFVSTIERMITFSYLINGVKYKNTQEIADSVDLNIFRAGGEFVVTYWVSNPQRSILNY